MSIHIDPIALNKFATKATAESVDLGLLHLALELPKDSLGTFEEATSLVSTINSHTVEVNQRLQATANALTSLSAAAKQAATLSDVSDVDIANRMKSINDKVDDARRSLIQPKL